MITTYVLILISQQGNKQFKKSLPKNTKAKNELLKKSYLLFQAENEFKITL
jgi:hypothetical protein